MTIEQKQGELMRTANRPTMPARPLAAAVAVLAARLLIVPVLVLPVVAAGPALAATSASSGHEHRPASSQFRFPFSPTARGNRNGNRTSNSLTIGPSNIVSTLSDDQ